MWPNGVVVVPPVLDYGVGLKKAGEPVLVQALVAETSVERFNEGILGRLSGLYEMQIDARIACPDDHGFAGELGPVVDDNFFG